jgi:hypothetical protein
MSRHPALLLAATKLGNFSRLGNSLASFFRASRVAIVMDGVAGRQCWRVDE